MVPIAWTKRVAFYSGGGSDGTGVQGCGSGADAEQVADPFVYLDLRTAANVDVCEYPDSGKINILPTIEVFEAKNSVPYYTGEEGVRGNWPEDIVKKGPA